MIYVIDGSIIGINIREIIKKYVNENKHTSVVSVGDLLRLEAKDNSTIWLEFSEYLDANELPPEQLNFKLVSKELDKNRKSGITSVLIGYPINNEDISLLDNEYKLSRPFYFFKASNSCVTNTYMSEWKGNRFSYLNKYYSSISELEQFISRQINLKEKHELYAKDLESFKTIYITDNNEGRIQTELSSLLEEVV